MKRSGFKKRNTPLKARVGLKAKKPWFSKRQELKKSAFKNTGSTLKRSGFKNLGKGLNRVSIRAKKERGSNPNKTLKTKLWRIFSQYIRLSYADKNGYVMTCDGSFLHWKDVHCGHLFVNSERNQDLGGNELWYYENNFAPQSSEGNYFNADDSAKKYTIWAIEKYGLEEVKKMERIKQIPRKFTRDELTEKYEYYKQKVDELLKKIIS